GGWDRGASWRQETTLPRIVGFSPRRMRLLPMASVLIRKRDAGWPDSVMPLVAAVWAHRRESATTRAATELVLFAAVTATRCIKIGSTEIRGETTEIKPFEASGRALSAWQIRSES